MRTFDTPSNGSKPNGSSNGAAKPDDKKDEKKDDAKPTSPAIVAKPAVATPPPAAAKPPSDAALARALELLQGGGFTRRLSWWDRRALRKVERNIDRVRQALQNAFPDNEASIAKSLDSLAHIEVTARLEMMRQPKPKK